MDPGQASTQDQSVQALMIQLCELKKCVGTVQWAEPPSTLRQKIPTRIGCEHKGLSCIHTRLGGYRAYGLNPELFFFLFLPSKTAFRKCLSSPASSFPTVAPLPVSTQIPPVALLAPFLPLPRLSTLLSNDSAHLRLPRSPVSTSAPLATDILRNHPQPCFYLWQTKATRLSICFWKAGLWRKQGYRRFLWHIHDLVMEVTMCCKPTILVYVCIWAYVGLSCIWVLYFCCCKVRPNVLLQRPAETRWRDDQFLFYDATRRFRMHFI